MTESADMYSLTCGKNLGLKYKEQDDKTKSTLVNLPCSTCTDEGSLSESWDLQHMKHMSTNDYRTASITIHEHTSNNTSTYYVLNLRKKSNANLTLQSFTERLQC